MRGLLLSIVLLFSLTTTVFGQAKAVITGPKEASLGDLIVLDGSRSEGLAFEWILTNSDKTYLAVDNNQKLVFASGTPGKYIFVLVVGGQDNNQKLVVNMVKHEVVIGGNVPVTPDVPVVTPITLPPGRFHISTDVYNWARAVGDKTVALKLAKNFESIAAQISAGTLTDSQQIVIATSNTNKETINSNSSNYDKWKNEFFIPLNTKLNALSETSLKNADDHVACWNEIALGLKTYGETK